MRKAFITDEEMEEVGTPAWAAELFEVDGGHLAFESVADADNWRAQS